MKAIALAVLTSLMGLGCAALRPGVVVHVSPSGNDQGTGSARYPFATLERARQAVREIRGAGTPPGAPASTPISVAPANTPAVASSSTPAGTPVRAETAPSAPVLTPAFAPIRVEIAPGAYRLSASLELGPRDSNTVWRATEPGACRISGGVEIPPDAWKPIADPAVLARIAEPARTHVRHVDLRALGVRDFGTVTSSVELFAGGRPQPLAGWPDEGFAEVGEVPDGKAGVFTVKGDRWKRWTTAPDAWFFGYFFWNWMYERLPVASMDAGSGVIRLSQRPAYGADGGIKPGARIRICNLIEELDRPGEWWLDRASGALYWWPEGEGGWASLSLLPQPLVTLNDCRSVSFDGLVFELGRECAVRIRDGAGNTIENCLVRSFSGNGIEIGTDSEYGNTVKPTHGGVRNRVIHCEITETGESGIVLSGGDRLALSRGDNEAVGNHIHRIARTQRTYCPGIALSGVGCRATGNHIHDLPHSAILFWGNDFDISENHIHHVCLESADAGAIYTGRDWTMRGTLIQGNSLHDIGGTAGLDDDTSAIYIDDFASGITVRGNRIRGVCRGVLIGGGRDNLIEGNEFEGCRKCAIHLDSRGTGWASYYFTDKEPILFDRFRAVNAGQPPYSERYPELKTVQTDQPELPKGNRLLNNRSQGGAWLDCPEEILPLVEQKDNQVR
jgi:hypothetical protein